MTADHDLSRAVEVRRLDRLARQRRRLAQCAGLGEVEADQRRHRALPDRHGLLHELAAQVREPDRVAQRQRARRDQRGPLAERVAGDDVEREAALAKHAKHRDRRGQDRRLRVLGQREVILGTLPAQLRQREAERIVGLVVGLLREGRLDRQIAAHADSLGALAREQERGLHRPAVSHADDVK